MKEFVTLLILFSLVAYCSELPLEDSSKQASIKSRIKLSKIEWIESFNGKMAACSGNPTLIQGPSTPGSLSLTGQALFRTGRKLDIVPDAPSAWSTVNDDYRVLGLRIQSFGRKSRVDSELTFVWVGAEEQRFSVVMEHKATSESLKLVVKDGGRIVGIHALQYSMLPADFIVGGNTKGEYVIQVNSLSQNREELFLGDAPFFANCKSMRASLEFRDAVADKKAGGANAEVVVDNLIIGRTCEDTIFSKVPFMVNPEPEFDPVKAGWRKVFEDDFNGVSLNMKKWEHAYGSVPERLKIHDGLCEIACDWASDHSKVTSASIHTMKTFGYGYYEARVKFRKEHGWWSAFWLSDYACTNPFIDSFEIDIYEDYLLRSEKPGDEPRRTLDHNLHVFVGNCPKSWNYNSTLPGDLERFYTIGCKWTPFEISYYLDGKLIKSSANHSPYSSVTFDAFNHFAGFTPMRAILSGRCGKEGGDPKNGIFPESFFCDFVKIYEYPKYDSKYNKTGPFVRFKDYPYFEPIEGSVLRVTADVRPNAQTKTPIKNVYLFDSGFLLDYKSAPPYDFDVLFSKEYFDTTEYVRKGREGKAPGFGPSQHALCLFAQDEAGVVSHSDVMKFYILPSVKSRPYKGVPQKIPGRIELANYDEGGQNVAYYDSSPGNSFQSSSETRLDEDVDILGDVLGDVIAGEWINYTVDIAEEGEYSAVLHYGTPMKHSRGVRLRLDGNLIKRSRYDWDALFKVKSHDNDGFEVDSFLEIRTILPKGRHILTLDALSSGINMDYIEFKRVEKERE
ncbi:MAG: family 16 glycosylhydrolase [Victivallales bacterium]|nr:family 16 glycosylhydrolase [Victivallales bacterium]